jgi:hypothetical protein
MSLQPDAVEANRLYWETDASVAEIADRFDLSRRALYELVRPFATGVLCPACGGSLEYENRLSRRAGQAYCPACGTRHELGYMEANPTFTPAFGDAPNPAASMQADARGDDRNYLPDEDARSNDLRQRAVILGGAAIAGIAIGTVAALWARRRD